MFQKIKKLKEEHLAHLEKELERVKNRLIQIGVKKIILFGSAVRNELNIMSDIDLLVIIDSNKLFIERLKEIYLTIQPSDVDILAYTPSEIEKMKENNLFIEHILKEGKLIYERNE